LLSLPEVAVFDKEHPAHNPKGYCLQVSDSYRIDSTKYVAIEMAEQTIFWRSCRSASALLLLFFGLFVWSCPEHSNAVIFQLLYCYYSTVVLLIKYF